MRAAAAATNMAFMTRPKVLLVISIGQLQLAVRYWEGSMGFPACIYLSWPISRIIDTSVLKRENAFGKVNANRNLCNEIRSALSWMGNTQDQWAHAARGFLSALDSSGFQSACCHSPWFLSPHPVMFRGPLYDVMESSQKDSQPSSPSSCSLAFALAAIYCMLCGK